MYLFIILQLKYVHHISNGYNSSTHTYNAIYVDTYTTKYVYLEFLYSFSLPIDAQENNDTQQQNLDTLKLCQK